MQAHAIGFSDAVHTYILLWQIHLFSAQNLTCMFSMHCLATKRNSANPAASLPGVCAIFDGGL
jgi:hypothetical protein